MGSVVFFTFSNPPKRPGKNSVLEDDVIYWIDMAMYSLGQAWIDSYDARMQLSGIHNQLEDLKNLRDEMKKEYDRRVNRKI